MKTFKTSMLTIATLLCSITASAHDFEVDGIYYNITSETDLTVEVTYWNDDYNSAKYIGEVVIPESVIYNGSTYFVTNIGNSAFRNCTDLTNIILPNSISNIGIYTFFNCYSLTDIIIPHSVMSIGNNAFRSCTALANIVIPNSVTSIGNSTFYNCSSLTGIIIPNSVTNIGNDAFYKCENLALVIDCSNLCITKGEADNGYVAYYAEKVINIGSGSYEQVGEFFFCTDSSGNRYLSAYIGSNKTVVLPNNYLGETYSIENNALFSSFHTVIVGSGVISIGSNQSRPLKTIWLTNTPPSGYNNLSGSINYVANEQYTDLSNTKVFPYLSSMFEVDGVRYVPVNMSERTCDAIDCMYDSSAENIAINSTVAYKGVTMTVKEVMPYTFYDNDYIKELTISNKGNIGEHAFHGCNGLGIITVSNQGNIETDAFRSCSGLEELEVSNEGYIGTLAFCGCTSLKTATISNKGNIEANAFQGCTGLEKLEVSNSGSIGTYAFQGCTSLKTATISNKNKIEAKAFQGCTGLEKLEVSNSGNIGTYAFQNCTSLKTATISNKGNIEANAFQGCTGLGTATISNQGTIGQDAFSGCSSFTTATLGKGITGISESAFANCSSLTEIIIPHSVKSVGRSCFSGCKAMQSATIGNGVTVIEGNTFKECTSLQRVNIGNSVTDINTSAFGGCTALQQIQWGKNVKTIGDYTFSYCSSLKELTIPKTVTNVSNYAFNKCTSLADVIIADRTQSLSLGSNGSSPLFADCPLDSVYIGGKITYETSSSSGYSPFYRNTSLRSVTIGHNEEAVYDNEFYGCTNLKNVSIGNGVKSIGNWAFSGCSSLDYFAFGGNVESIGQEAFSDCTNMTQLISSAVVPPTCGAQALEDINKWNCTLKVPKGYTSAYQAADQWKDFFFLEEFVSALKETAMDKAVPAHVDVYTLQGVKIREQIPVESLENELPRGIYIVNGKKVMVR